MAEERIIDDEYGREVKFRKRKDGSLDIVDGLAEGERENTEGEEEYSFAFPIIETDEDDEDLEGLSPEEAIALRQKKIEASRQRRAEYERTVEEGNALLATGSYRAAELKFEKALDLDERATEASVGYWRAKTADFSEPDLLIEEYLEAGIESLEFDLGYEAVDEIKQKYRSVFEKKVEELGAEEKPLAEEVEGKQVKRRKILKARRKKDVICFAAAGVPLLVFLILTAVFGLKNFSTPDDTYIPVTILFGALSLVTFIVFSVFTNKLVNTCRIFRANERVASTEEGERLLEIRAYKELYEALLIPAAEEEEGEKSSKAEGIAEENSEE